MLCLCAVHVSCATCADKQTIIKSDNTNIVYIRSVDLGVMWNWFWPIHMETLRGIIPSVPTETVEFTKACPQKWKCDKCGVITVTLWRSTSTPTTNGYGSAHQNGGTPNTFNSGTSLVPYCAHRFCGQCLETIFVGIQTVGKCPLDTIPIYKKQVTFGVTKVIFYHLVCQMNHQKVCATKVLFQGDTNFLLVRLFPLTRLQKPVSKWEIKSWFNWIIRLFARRTWKCANQKQNGFHQ